MVLFFFTLAPILELKPLLWHSVLTTPAVLFLNYAVIKISANELNASFLILPGSLLLIAASLYCTRGKRVILCKP